MPGEGPRRLVETRQRGWVDPRAAAAHFDYRPLTCVPELEPFVGHFWVITWDLARPYTQQLVSRPAVNLTITEDFARVAGVVRGGFAQTLAGRGRVIGVHFRPGGFRPFLRGPVSALTDRFIPISDMYGDAGAALARDVLGTEDAEAALSLIERFLLGLGPVPDPVVDEVAALVDRIDTDMSLTRVDQVAALAGMSMRSLQRLFHDYVGVGPKWVIRRCRLHEAAARASEDDPPDLARLAAELGYTDQAHLTRDFTAAVGRSPAAYARDSRPG